ncbi:MAG TPA: DUF2283 domain-containing protein [Rubricoccaceae bacterium]|nr:DUF2283 domain-containing protein [Rubricoccaceae bacterium]
MRVEYFPDTDTLSILFLPPGATAADALDTPDPDVLLFRDAQGRIGEVLIEHASKRVDLAELRRHVSFEEVTGSTRERPTRTAA